MSASTVQKYTTYSIARCLIAICIGVYFLIPLQASAASCCTFVLGNESLCYPDVNPADVHRQYSSISESDPCVEYTGTCQEVLNQGNCDRLQSGPMPDTTKCCLIDATCYVRAPDASLCGRALTPKTCRALKNEDSCEISLGLPRSAGVGAGTTGGQNNATGSGAGGGSVIPDPLNRNITGISGAFGIAGDAVRALTGIMGALALAIVAYAGILIILSGNNPSRREKGKKMVQYAFFGALACFMSYVFIGFLLTALNG